MIPGPPPALRIAGAAVLAGGRSAVRDVRIAGARLADPADDTPAGTLPLGGHLVLPGLVNAHAHLQLDVFPPTRPRRRYDHAADWVADMAAVIERPAMRRLRALPEAARAWHGGLSAALSGVTTVAHHDPRLPIFDDPRFPTHVVPCAWAHSTYLAGRYGPALREARAGAPAGRPFFVHVAEGTDARAAAELDRLAAAGGLDHRTVLVHGVGLRPADVARALAAGAALAWCPAANRFLLGRPADPRPFLAAGRAGLGTDSRLTGARDLLDTLRAARDTGLAGPEALLAMVTTMGAAVVGRPEVGRLAAGAPADLIVLRDDGRPPARQLLDARRADLRLVVSGGRPIVADPDLAPAFAALGEPARAATLDGRDKLVSARAVARLRAAGIVEPGLVLGERATLDGADGRPGAERATVRGRRAASAGAGGARGAG